MGTLHAALSGGDRGPVSGVPLVASYAPVFHVVSEDVWGLWDMRDVPAAARDFATFSQLEGVGVSRNYGGLGLTSLDPAAPHRDAPFDGTVVRPRAVKQRPPQAVEVLDRLLDQVFAASKPVNVAEEVANPYLSTIVGDLIGAAGAGPGTGQGRGDGRGR